MDGPSDEVAFKYVRGMVNTDTFPDIGSLISRLPPDPAIRFNNITVLQDNCPSNYVVTGKPVEILIDYEVLQETHGLRVFFVLSDSEGNPLFRSFAHGEADELPTMRPGKYISYATIPADFLAPITYQVGISAAIHNVRRCFPEDIYITLFVQEAGRLKYAYAHSGGIGVKLAPLIQWTTKVYSDADSD